MCAVFAARQTTMLPGTVKNFELPNFDEETGIKEWELFGTSATYINDSRIDIENIKLDLYEKRKEANNLRATIKSPTAQVNPNTKISESLSDISVTATEFDMTGKKWKWNGDKRFVEVFSDVKINIKPRTKEEKPTVFTSQYASLEYDGDANIFELRKDVETKTDEMSLTCQYLHAKSPKHGSGISDIIAKGDVKMLRDGRETFAQETVIDPKRGVAVLTGKPKITDISSKAELSGNCIVLSKDEKKIDAFSDKGTRATAVIYHTDNGGKSQKITIHANKIELSQKETENLFVFKGNVKILADDFKADCDNLYANSATKEGEKTILKSIKGIGNVRFENENGIATSKELLIVPQEQQICLEENATLKNPERGTTLTADLMIFFRNQNKGLAIANRKNKNAFVCVEIEESPTIQDATGGKSNSKKKTRSVIKSRKLTFFRAEKSMTFDFEKDVSINSDNVNATCQKMTIFAETDDNRTTNAKKIIAKENVVVKQNTYSATAEVATIFPRLNSKKSDNANKQIHKFIELSIDPLNPALRPTIILPPLGNIGLTDIEPKAKDAKKSTIIKSDKQWLTTAQNVDRYYFQGDVDIDSSSMKSTCEKIEVIMRAKKKDAEKEITQIIMTEDVCINQDLTEARCGRADIYTDEQMAVLSNNPVVINREDNSRASGHRIIYNKGTRTIAFESDPNASENTPQQQPSQEFEIPTDDLDNEQPEKNRAKIKLPIRKRNK